MENTTTTIPSGTVVVGIDGSPSADRALDWAVDHARREQRQLTLAHGLDPSGSVLVEVGGVGHVELVDAMRTDALAMLARARRHVAELAPDLHVNEALWMSHPQVTLLELAERAAMVVVGSRGRGPVTSLLLGSVGVALTRHAPCPVVVVRPGHSGAVRQGVLVGTDASERTRPVLEFAYRQASVRDLPLTILHATKDKEADLHVSEAVAGLAEKFPEVRARVQVVREGVADVLAHESERTNLLVLGAHHPKGLLHGSVTTSVIERAVCPVAVVPLAGSATHGRLDA